MKLFSTIFITLLSTVLTNTISYAEKSDRNKPTHIEANQMTYDDIKQVNTFNGNAVLIRGSLTTKAEKIIVTTTPEGHQIATLFAPESGLATFRQKRDGGANLWIEGQAKRIEYDNKTEQAKFFSKARLKLLNGNKVTDEVEGEFITYDGLTEFFSVNNAQSGRPNAGRVRAMLSPVDEKEKSK